MSRCQKTGNVTAELVLELFRRLPPEKQKEYLGSLRTCISAENFRKARNILKRGESPSIHPKIIKMSTSVQRSNDMKGTPR